MSKEIYISSTPHETRLAIVESDALTEIYYERENEYTLAGSIYNGKVTRVLPGMQSSFVDIGLERDAFLYITDFMEEAGDSADFEASANAGDSRGGRGESSRADATRSDAGRSEGGRGENGRTDGGQGRRDRGGNRNDRDQLPREGRTTEPTDAELFNEAVAGLEPSRPSHEGARPAQEGGRGRRGRGRDRNRGPQGDSAPRQTQSPQGAEMEEGAQEDSTLEPAPILGHPSSVETEQLGEGAPGADGSRRWRGRRGRRGRGGERGDRQPGGGQANLPPSNAQGPEPSSDVEENRLDESPEPLAPTAPRASTGPIENAYGEPADFEADENFEADAEVKADAQIKSAAGFETRAGSASQGGLDLHASAPDRRSTGRDTRHNRGSERGGRDRSSRDRGPRGSNFDRPADGQQPSPYDAEPEAGPGIEPLILPGESLSKYRPGGAAPEAMNEAAAPTPTVDAFVASGWDGGMVLPGETLRPRGPVGGSVGGHESEARFQTRDDRSFRADRTDRGGRGDRGRNDRPRPEAPSGGRATGRNDGFPSDATITDSTRTPQVANAETYATGTQHSVQTPLPEQTETHDAPVATYLSDPDKALPSHLITPLDTTFVPPPPFDTAAADELASRATPAAEPTCGEMMPMDLSAAAESEDSTENEPAEYEPTGGSASYRIDPVPPSEYRQASPVLEDASFAGPDSESTGTAPDPELARSADAPFAESDPADLHTVSPELRHALDVAAAPEAEAPQITSMNDLGEMHSEDATLTDHELPSIEISKPTEPILHETAVIAADSSASDSFVPAHTASARPTPAQAAAFAPGDGMLEEEMIEEDEDAEPGSPMPVLHAHTEDADQETLEGAADLGSMLREMSIDQITRPELPRVDQDEDNFEDDFFEEDQNFDTEEAQASEQDSDSPDPDSADERFAESDELESSEYGSGFEGEHNHTASETEANASSELRREGGRRDGRRNGRGDRNRRGGADRTPLSAPAAPERISAEPRPERSDRGNGGYNDRSNGRRDHRGGGRQSAQLTNLPAISDLLKPGQELLCQIAKEPIAKKGARITSHIALPGRFLVFMPTVSHTGVSRKIESDGERRRLKEILLSEKGDAAGGFIVRTAASGASEDELRSDLRFLLNLWSDIKARSESSKSPALIYHDLNLVERVLRDQVTDTFSAIWVDTESQYEQVLRFLQRFQPSLIRRVKLYTKETPLFEQFGITEEINKALRSKVWLKSGGSIVINQTEALVAIDINTGKFVGKTARLEDTIVKTNLDAIPEIVRQIRLRDLGGIIIIDFIDMDERKNRAKVMAALEEELKSDRAPSKVLQFNDFGLVAITRKRVKQSLERTLSTTCGICAGTGMVKSPVTVCNDIYVEMRKMSKHLDRGDVMLRVNPEVVKQLKSSTRWLQEMEEMVGKTILIKSDPSLHPEQFDIH